MRPVFLLFAALTLSVGPAAAQDITGYTLQEGIHGINELAADFDSDGKQDTISVIERGDHLYVCASLQNGQLALQSKDAPYCCSYLEFVKNVVVLHSTGMRAFSTWRFRYNAALRNFQMIGWDTESFGNGANDGSGTSSLNLLTGTFIAKYNSWDRKQGKLIALPVVSRKVKITRRILLTDFGEDSDEWLSNLTHKLLPAAVQ